MHTILALDLATVTGWAVNGPDSTVADSGSHRFPKTGEDVGAFLLAFEDWLLPQMLRWLPREVVFESPMLPRETQLATLRKLYGLAGETERVCSKLRQRVAYRKELGLEHPFTDLIVREAHRDACLKHFLAGKVPRDRAERKLQTVRMCQIRGWDPADDNEADALAILDYTLALRQPAHALEATSLFSTRGAA